ncbi:hypothetical protein OPU71_20835 [Niveibacterium sp. 24ML]|uniref:hypothetical protein n=1 Tax=Niveibacterium sp. 24ML TaxID=2985512 RepID=UPI00227085BA|nr:hypothetical protein [Niveibacterium sp. 24ML]MCX9158566.1 hypothetical protein [Niveibacterium sp. 24ML]
MLSDIEDRLLAMCEGDPVTIQLARDTLGIWYEKPFERKAIIQIASRLAKLGLLKWQYRKKTKQHFTKRFPCRCAEMQFVTIRTTKAGDVHLAKPREVMQ